MRLPCVQGPKSTHARSLFPLFFKMGVTAFPGRKLSTSVFLVYMAGLLIAFMLGYKQGKTTGGKIREGAREA